MKAIFGAFRENQRIRVIKRSQVIRKPPTIKAGGLALFGIEASHGGQPLVKGESTEYPDICASEAGAKIASYLVSGEKLLQSLFSLY